MSNRSYLAPCLLFVLGVLGCGSETPAGTGGVGGASASSSGTLVSSTGASGGGLPAVFTVAGIVTDGQGPVAGAIVMQGGGAAEFVTGPDGAFSLALTTEIPGTPTIVAAKEGYRSAGIEFATLEEGPVELVLREVAPPDNAEGYVYGAPGVGDAAIDTSTAVCGHCHTTLVGQFQQSAHARSARDPLVQDLYAGTAVALADAASCAAAGGLLRDGRVPGSESAVGKRCYVGHGVLPDLNGCGGAGELACDDPARPEAERPKLFGACADCHAAGLRGPQGGRDLLDATSIAFENGNHCDTCHKVRDILLEKPPGTAGRLVVQRPNEALSEGPGAKLRQVMFGPLPDVPNDFMGGSLQPKFAQAIFCAGCHEQAQGALLPGAAVDPARFPGGLPTHSTYAEWSASPWAEAGAPCQHCHMPPNEGLFNSLDVTVPEKAGLTFGFVRPPEQTRSHVFRGPLVGTPRLVEVALGMWMTAQVNGQSLEVEVTVSNQGAGHAFPTGEPMRSLLLVLQAQGCGQQLAPTGGATVFDTGGAYAEGVVGQGVDVNGKVLSWPSGAAKAEAGQVVRVVRDTGVWDDYPGVGFFANPALEAIEKGLPLRAPVGEGKIVAVGGGAITVDTAIGVLPGDRVFLGDGLAGLPVDGAPSLALAGRAGYAFARVLVDPKGERNVPHYRAVDMASDNRLPPLVKVKSAHVFGLPAGCASGSVEAAVVYRPVPVQWAKARGWEARDWVVGVRKEVALGN